MLNVLRNECGVCEAFDPTIGGGGDPPPISQFTAIWDTGATNSLITQNVVDTIGLIPSGIAQVHGVSGPSQSETYLVNIVLPNNVMIGSVRVTKGNFLGADVLIGMDIINMGDFAVTNFGGVTKFSFRIPSQAHVDFVASTPPIFQHGGQGNRAERRRKKKATRRR